MQITSASQKTAADLQSAGQRFVSAVGGAMLSSVNLGASIVTEAVAKNQLGIRSRGGLAGLSSSIFGWMIDAENLLAAMGVPSNSPAAAYAYIQNEGSGYLPGGVIKPVRAKRLAVPVSDEAKRYTSPRDMRNLTLIHLNNGRMILATVNGENVTTHWVLQPYVYLKPTHWFDHGVKLAEEPMTKEFDAEFAERLGTRV